MTKIKQYLGNKGELILISEMHDAHVLNAYAKNKKRLEKMKKQSFLSQYDIDLNNLVESLHAEIKRRKLI
jgi:hypothetical protein